MTPPRVSAPAEGKDIPMRDQQNRNARRKRLLRQILRLAGMAVLAAVVVFLAIRVVDALRSSGGGDASGSAGSQAVTSSGEPIDYASLVYRNDTATLRFLCQDGEWTWQDDPDFPLLPDTVAAVVAAVEELPLRQTLTEFEDLSSYDLDEPSYTLTLTWTDGREESLAIGKATDNGDGRYVLRNGDETTLYIITDNLTALLDRPIYSMMALPETKTLAETQLTAVTYTAGETELRLVASAAEDGSVTWKYGNQDVTEKVQSAVAVLSGWEVQSCVDYEPSHDAAVLCGFGSPTARIDLEYQDAAGATQTLRYTVGNTVPGGDGRCLRIGDDRTIFAVTAESAAAVLALGDLAA